MTSLAFGSAVAGPLPPSELLTAYYRPDQLLLVETKDFDFKNMTLFWDDRQPRPTLTLVYHRAIPYLDRGLTLHFSLTVDHYPQSRSVKPDKPCQQGQTRKIWRHPRLGPYRICSKEVVNVSQVPGMSREPLRHVLASLTPLPGNRAEHVLIHLDAFGDEILLIAASLHTYGD